MENLYLIIFIGYKIKLNMSESRNYMHIDTKENCIDFLKKKYESNSKSAFVENLEIDLDNLTLSYNNCGWMYNIKAVPLTFPPLSEYNGII
jgi:hypothetical protein